MRPKRNIGSIIILFALILPIFLATIGLSIDIGRVLLARRFLKSAVNESIVALAYNQSTEVAQQICSQNYNLNYPLQVKITNQTAKLLTLSATSQVPLYLLPALNVIGLKITSPWVIKQQATVVLPFKSIEVVMAVSCAKNAVDTRIFSICQNLATTPTISNSFFALVPYSGIISITQEQALSLQAANKLQLSLDLDNPKPLLTWMHTGRLDNKIGGYTPSLTPVNIARESNPVLLYDYLNLSATLQESATRSGTNQEGIIGNSPNNGSSTNLKLAFLPSHNLPPLIPLSSYSQLDWSTLAQHLITHHTTSGIYGGNLPILGLMWGYNLLNSNWKGAFNRDNLPLPPTTPDNEKIIIIYDNLGYLHNTASVLSPAGSTNRNNDMVRLNLAFDRLMSALDECVEMKLACKNAPGTLSCRNCPYLTLEQLTSTNALEQGCYCPDYLEARSVLLNLLITMDIPATVNLADQLAFKQSLLQVFNDNLNNAFMPRYNAGSNDKQQFMDFIWPSLLSQMTGLEKEITQLNINLLNMAYTSLYAFVNDYPLVGYNLAGPSVSLPLAQIKSMITQQIITDIETPLLQQIRQSSITVYVISDNPEVQKYATSTMHVFSSQDIPAACTQVTQAILNKMPAVRVLQ